jgi:hypothetical protein
VYPPFLFLNNGKFDFTNSDSIYFITADTVIRIFNFNTQGLMNFTYEIDYNNRTYKAIRGIKATEDGGVIIVTDSYVIKYNPNGIIGLSSVNDHEVSAIVFPNPAKDELNIVASEKINYLEIFNLWGVRVFEQKCSSMNAKCDVSNLSKGNYFVRIHTNKGVVTRKVVVE